MMQAMGSTRRRSVSSPTRPPQKGLLHPFLVLHTRPLGRITFPFLPSVLPSCLHLFLLSLLSSCLFLFFLPSCHLLLRFLRHFTPFLFTFVEWHSVLCDVLLYHILFLLKSSVATCFCVGLSSLVLLLPFSLLLRLGSEHKSKSVHHPDQHFALLIAVM